MSSWPEAISLQPYYWALRFAPLTYALIYGFRTSRLADCLLILICFELKVKNIKKTEKRWCKFVCRQRLILVRRQPLIRRSHGNKILTSRIATCFRCIKTLSPWSKTHFLGLMSLYLWRTATINWDFLLVHPPPPLEFVYYTPSFPDFLQFLSF